MAWDEYERDGRVLMSGDDPIDEFAVTLQRIAAAYKTRFDRLPLVDELMVSLEHAISVRPGRFVLDPEGVEDARFRCERIGAVMHVALDLPQYEGAYMDEPPPGRYVVDKIAPGKAPQIVITVPRLDVVGRTLEIEYEIEDLGLDDTAAELLIRRKILEEFSDNFYRDKADKLSLRNRKTGAAKTVPYD